MPKEQTDEQDEECLATMMEISREIMLDALLALYQRQERSTLWWKIARGRNNQRLGTVRIEERTNAKPS